MNETTPARAAASVLSDGELSAALGLWHRLRDDDGTLVETVARAIADSIDGGPFSDREWRDAFDDGVREVYRDAAAAAIEALRGEAK